MLRKLWLVPVAVLIALAVPEHVGADSNLPLVPNKVLTQLTQTNDYDGTWVEIIRVIHSCYVVLNDKGVAPIPCPTPKELRG